jgi:2-polyprenyl-6-methoxyphenol hydroxylase-like FAD-dependent oxidoreductase
VKIAVIGAGPGGLYFSLLARKRDPALDITVYERNPEDATFGFGIALQGNSWDFLREDDQACLDDIIAHSTMLHGQVITHKGESIEFKTNRPNAGIERLTLLRILRHHAEVAGVAIRYGQAIDSLEPYADCDLVVGADGINSFVRRAHDKEFGTSERILTSRMAWYGATRRIEPSRLTFRETRFGYFWSVGYGHSATQSTFVAECEEKAWRQSGLAQMSPQEQVAFTETLFVDELQGARILSNHSAWKALPVIRVKQWSVGNRVLLGDALHSPHPSIGSGTRLSMGDAAALAASVVNNPSSVTTALAHYRAQREPVKMKLVVPMERSLEWYETIGSRADAMTPAQLVFDYMSRTGRMSLERMQKDAPEFFARYGALMQASASPPAIAAQ